MSLPEFSAKINFSPDKGTEGGKEREPIDVVRIIPMTFRSVRELREDFAQGKEIQEIELTRVILTLKSEESDTSYGLIMPIGGKMEEGETPLDAARRKLREESLLYPMGGHWWESDPTVQIFLPLEGDYTYRIVGREETTEAPEEPRRAVFVPYPVLPPEYTRKRPRNPGVAKIRTLESFTRQEFRDLIEHGDISQFRDDTGPLGSLDGPSHSFDVAGSITKATKYDIDIDPENRARRDALLGQLIDRVDEFEGKVWEEVLYQVNRERRHLGKSKVAALEQTDLAKKSMVSKAEIIRAFEVVQLSWYLRDERIRERRGDQRPPSGVDLLNFAWYMAGEGIEPADLGMFLFEAPTKNIGRNIRQFVIALRQAFVAVEMEEAGSRLQEDGPLPSQVSLKRGFSVRAMEEKFASLEPLQRAEYVRKLDAVFLTAYAKLMGVSEDAIREVRARIDPFFQHLVESSMQVPTDYRKIFQPNKLLNEVVNSPLVRLTLLALKINPYAPGERITDDRLQRQLEYEATRHLAFIGHGVRAWERYRMLLHNGNEPIEAIFNGQIFTLPLHEERRESRGRIYRVTHRQTRFAVFERAQHVAIDAKGEPKSFDSFLRKSFYEPLEEICDVFSRNIILVEDDELEKAGEAVIKPGRFRAMAEARITAARIIAIEIKTRFRRACAEPGWSLEFADEKDTYEQLEKHPALLRRAVSGKRPGSRGNLIIRETFNLILRDKEGKEFAEEVVIYPFTSFSGTPYEGILWGHEEKILDEATRGYAFRRLMEPEPGFPDLPSFYIMTNPPHIYTMEAEALYFSSEETAAEEAAVEEEVVEEDEDGEEVGGGSWEERVDWVNFKKEGEEE